MIPENKWTNCYEESWQDIIVPEAFSHPAKMSYGLLMHILLHAAVHEWIKEGDVILDPFGGIGSTGILGAYEGYQVVCCELEEKFVKLAEQNFELHRNAWQKLGCPEPVMLQGDSRRLCEIVEKADAIISSPPFVDSEHNYKHGLKVLGDNFKGRKAWETKGGTVKKADLVVSSPPFQQSDNRGGTKMPNGYFDKVGGIRTSDDFQGQTSGNLGNLKSGDVKLILSSPPYEKALSSFDKISEEFWSKNKEKWGRTAGKRGRKTGNYGNSEGQLGQEQGETFWSAAKLIIEQCYQILKPGGHAIWVVKSFVRKGAIVDFPGDWQRLCEAVGFNTVCIHHAMLVKETTHKTLFGHTEVKRKEKKSFFRRLAESKGSPKIDFEVVLCTQKKD